MTDEEAIEPKIRLDKSVLRRMKITAEISLTVEEWGSFIRHAEKTGGTLIRKIADGVQPMIEKAKKAIEGI